MQPLGDGHSVAAISLKPRWRHERKPSHRGLRAMPPALVQKDDLTMAKPLVIAQTRIVLDDPHACTIPAMCCFGRVWRPFDTLVRRDDAGHYASALATRLGDRPGCAGISPSDSRGRAIPQRRSAGCGGGEILVERMARPDMGATGWARRGVYAQYLAGMVVTCPDPNTVTVALAAPMADLFDVLVAGNIVSPRAITEAGDDLVARAIGTGPWRLEAYKPGEQIELSAVPGHFDGPVAHERLRFIRGETPGRAACAASGGFSRYRQCSGNR